MTTTLDLIKSAFRKVGANTFNDEPTANEANDALASLNQLLDSWANDSLVIYSRTYEDFPLTGAESYSVGSGQDFDTAPFTKIISMYARTGEIDYYLEPLDDDQYSRISYKDISTVPQYYRYTNGFPVARLDFYPIPSGAYRLFVVSEKPLSNLTLNETINLPPGWERALVYNLAVEISAEYGQNVPQVVFKIAGDSLGAIKSQVAKARGLSLVANTKGVNNIYGGWYS